MLSTLRQRPSPFGIWQCAQALTSVGLPQRSSKPPAGSFNFVQTTTIRGFSVIRSSGPNYTIFGENCMLNLRVLLPEFRLSKSNYLIQDANRRGRLLMEWTPRVDGGGVNRDNCIRFGLSAEEVGFLLHQLPDRQVEFSRKTSLYTSSTPGQLADDMPEKVMRVTPKEGGQFSLLVDFEKNGMGGQSPGLNDPSVGPLEVTAQLGEWEVMQQLMRSSIPALVGWDVQLRLAVQYSIEAVQHGPGGMP